MQALPRDGPQIVGWKTYPRHHWASAEAVCAAFRLQRQQGLTTPAFSFQQVQDDMSKARSVNKDWEFVSKGTEISANRPARADSPMVDEADVEKSFWLSRPDGWVHTPILTGLWALVVDREWEVEVVPLVVGQRSVKEKEWLETLSIFGIGKEDGKRIIGRLGHTVLNEHEKLFGSYWRHTFGPSSSLLQLLVAERGDSRCTRHPLLVFVVNIYESL
jgi:hypothetical protein